MPKNNTYLWEIQWQKHLLLLLFLCLLLPITHASAQPDETTIYTKENPLVYEDAEDLWPYSFLNDEGQPEGFNIDLVEKLLKELNIPYVMPTDIMGVIPSRSSPRASSRRRRTA